jgi:hypothetical protein
MFGPKQGGSKKFNSILLETIPGDAEVAIKESNASYGPKPRFMSQSGFVELYGN